MWGPRRPGTLDIAGIDLISTKTILCRTGGKDVLMAQTLIHSVHRRLLVLLKWKHHFSVLVEFNIIKSKSLMLDQPGSYSQIFML